MSNSFSALQFIKKMQNFQNLLSSSKSQTCIKIYFNLSNSMILLTIILTSKCATFSDIYETVSFSCEYGGCFTAYILIRSSGLTLWESLRVLIAFLAEHVVITWSGTRNDTLRWVFFRWPSWDETAWFTAILSQINIAGFVPETQFRLLLYSQLIKQSLFFNLTFFPFSFIFSFFPKILYYFWETENSQFWLFLQFKKLI